MMNNIGLEHYLILYSLVFAIGVVGLLIRKNTVINILMSIELMLLSINMNFVSFSAFSNNLTGQIFSIALLTIAAAETAIGLAILVLYYRQNNSIAIDHINQMKG